MDKLIDLFPPKIRKVLYVLLAFVSLVAPVVIAALQDGWQTSDLSFILTSLLAGGGFTMAAANTNVT
ncbi:MAG: hypothetical protein KDC87_15935 [Planctomycetes bacterium]|nr:hypothetical protein [Planctomycetota bacterium]